MHKDSTWEKRRTQILMSFILFLRGLIIIKKYTYIYINWEDNLSFDSEWRLRLKPFSQRTAGPRYLITPRECLLCGAFVEVLEELVKYTRGPERQMADFQD